MGEPPTRDEPGAPTASQPCRGSKWLDRPLVELSTPDMGSPSEIKPSIAIRVAHIVSVLREVRKSANLRSTGEFPVEGRHDKCETVGCLYIAGRMARRKRSLALYSAGAGRRDLYLQRPKLRYHNRFVSAYWKLRYDYERKWILHACESVGPNFPITTITASVLNFSFFDGRNTQCCVQNFSSCDKLIGANQFMEHSGGHCC
jgi:hypothetical protein